MPGHKKQHKNWIRSHSDSIVSILRRGPHFAASFNGHDRKVVIIPAFPDGSIIMGETYRAIMDDISMEFPSALCPEGEDPDDVVTRLSRIHTHAEVSERMFIGEVYPSPGYIDQIVLLYLVKISKPQSGKMTPGEGMLSLRALSVQEISETIAKGGMADALTSACLMRYLTLNRRGEGLMPTRMRNIEILDADDEPITAILTNRPEWSFIEYQEENPGTAVNWRFQEVEDIASPTGEPIPVKSSLAMRLMRNGPAPKPAYQGQGDSSPQDDETPDPVVDAAQTCETDLPHVDHSDPEDAEIEPPQFASLRSAYSAKDRSETEASESIHEEDAPPKEEVPAQPLRHSSPLFKRVSPIPEPAAPLPPHEAPHETSDGPEVTAPPFDGDRRRIDHASLPKSPKADAPRRRLTLSMPTSSIRESVQQDEITSTDAPREQTAPQEEQNVPKTPDPVHSEPAYAQDAPLSASSLTDDEGAKPDPAEPSVGAGIMGAWKRIEPLLSSPSNTTVNAKEKLSSDTKAPEDVLAAPKRTPKRTVSAPEKESAGLSRLTGFLRKAIQKDEPEAPSRTEAPREVLYGIDDAFADPTPPGPVFKPPQGWGQDKS